MEFRRNDTLLITQGGKFFDQARIDWIEETGDGRVLHMVSKVRNENRMYKIGEVRDEIWQVFFLESLEDAKIGYHAEQEILALEIV